MSRGFFLAGLPCVIEICLIRDFVFLLYQAKRAVGQMGIHQIFAQNLRRKSERYESIAEACKQVKVNRQQFNKYLSGAMLPNARTLKRICEVFEIEDWELFLPPNNRNSEVDLSMSSTFSKINTLQPANNLSSLADMLGQFQIEPNFTTGLYNCYFPLPGFRGFAVRSSLLISKSTKSCNFIRHTRISSPSEPDSTLAHGKHRGVVLSNGTMDYFFGVNSVSPANLSFMVFPREATKLKVGLANIYGLSQHFACWAIIEQVGQSGDFKTQALTKHSIISTHSSDLNPAVAKILNSQSLDETGQLTLPNAEKLLLKSADDPI